MSVGQRFPAGGWRARANGSAVPVARDEATLPTVAAAAPDPPAILGFPAEAADDQAEVPPVPVHRAATAGQLALVRRADPVGGGLLVWAGVAAAVSLAFPWTDAGGDIGLSLVRRGVAVVTASGLAELGRSGPWEAVAVVLGGGVLAILGLLLFLPASTHRLLGLLAFVVAEVAAAGIVTELAEAGWAAERFQIGMWFGAAVPALGMLGALKAMLTAQRLAPRA